MGRKGAKKRGDDKAKLAIRKVTSIKDGVTIIHRSSFHVNKGDIVAILGPSGSGKTSMLRLLNRLDEPASGEVLLDGRSILEMEPQELRRAVGMVFQLPTLFEGSVKENVAFGPRLHGLEEVDMKVREALRAVGLPVEFLERSVDKLSVGQAQRVTIARAIANGPEVLLMDEPTSALDPEATQGIEDLIRKLRDDLGLTFVVVTHDGRQARRLGTHVVLIEDGRVTEFSTVDDFFERHPIRETDGKGCCRH
jgi:ABC-type methionine transport system ATPase subunit